VLLPAHDRALHDPTAGPIDLHQYARQLLAQKKAAEAMEVFQLNAKLHPNTWPVHLGLARGYAALGKRKEAIEHAKAALPQAPDEANRKNIQDIIRRRPRWRPWARRAPAERPAGSDLLALL
jgi:tetratricopeptide (TPR) repeat protein